MRISPSVNVIQVVPIAFSQTPFQVKFGGRLPEPVEMTALQFFRQFIMVPIF